MYRGFNKCTKHVLAKANGDQSADEPTHDQPLDHVEGALPGQLHQRVAQICAQVVPPITEPYAQPLGRLHQQTTQPDHDENGGAQPREMNE